MKPLDIERQSFEIIARELGGRKPDPEVDLVVRRVIHTTADFDYFDNLVFSPHAVPALQAAIREGCPIVTDTTALFAISELVRAGKLRPRMVIGVPVGFVNVVEAKEEILSLDIPHIVARGRKGGSNVAAAIVNAALYQMVKREE